MTAPSPDSIRELRAEVRKTLDLVSRQRGFYTGFLEGDFRRLGQGTAAAIVIAEVLTNYYTCVETLLWRIAQFFENRVPQERWHAEVLRRMTLHIEGVREKVIEDETFTRLDELRRFRHFRRYYFSMDYDWGRLGYLQVVYRELADLLERDLGRFDRFLQALDRACSQ
jgi:hypothetical protein